MANASWQRNYDYGIILFDLGVAVVVMRGETKLGNFDTVDEAEEVIATTVALMRASYGQDD